MDECTMYELVFRVFLSACIGGIIGYERHNRSKVAGVRTHCIVAMAASVFTIVSVFGFIEGKADISRVASSIVSGIGFLGAGIIFVRNDSVQGLTTAAGIWATAAVGMCMGTGLYLIGIVAAVIIVGVQLIFRHSSYIGDLRVNMSLQLKMKRSAHVRGVMDEMEAIGCSIIQARISAYKDSTDYMLMNLVLSSAKGLEPLKIIKKLETIDGVDKVSLS